MKTKCYLIYYGILHDNEYPIAVYEKYDIAKREIEEKGYRYNEKSDVFLSIDKPKYYRIEEITLNKLSN